MKLSAYDSSCVQRNPSHLLTRCLHSMIKEHTTNQAQAACELVADRRQCLTGTPLQNSLNDLFSLVRFLRLEPFTDRGLWTQYIGAPTKIGDPLGVSRLQVIMRHLALRRTKTTVGKDGRPILSLPGKKDEMRYLELDEREKAFYASHHRRYKSNFLKLEESDSLLKNYCSILQELLRLRQICAHMALVRDSEDAELLKGNGSEDLIAATKRNGLTKGRAIQLLALMRDAGSAQCAECACDLLPAANALGGDDLVEDCEKRGGEKGKRSRKGKASDNNDDCLRPTQRPVLTRCQHLFCLQCFRAQVSAGWPSCSADERAACSACREEMTPILDAIEVLPSELEANQVDGADGGVVGRKVGTVKDRRRQQNGYAVEHSTKVKYVNCVLWLLNPNLSLTRFLWHQGSPGGSLSFLSSESNVRKLLAQRCPAADRRRFCSIPARCRRDCQIRRFLAVDQNVRSDRGRPRRMPNQISKTRWLDDPTRSFTCHRDFQE